jgi:large subunit ribosomal protein L32
MAVPKKRLTHRRRNNRRKAPGHGQVQLAKLATCSNCGSKTLPHRVCPTCGYYRGKKILIKMTA